MTIFGNSAIDMVLNQGVDSLGSLANDNTPVALFLFLEQFPWSTLLSLIAVAMIVVFFVTSCDSGAMVIDMLCSHGNNNTPLWQRVYWTAGVGIIAAVLLLSDGLNALQTMTIASALPFAVVLAITMYGLMKALRVEAYKRDSLLYAPSPVLAYDNQDAWRERLQHIVDFPSKKRVLSFINNTCLSALKDVQTELASTDISAQVSSDNEGIIFTIEQANDQPFTYAIYPKEHIQPAFASDNNQQTGENYGLENGEMYYRAEVHLGEGGQDYCIMGWSKNAIINDIVDHYHKHMYFLHLMR